jgi:hypothetical protein
MAQLGRGVVVSTGRSFDSEDMARRGVIGAHVLHSRYDSRDLTKKARETFLSSFDLAVDPEQVLPPSERKRRSAHLRKAHYQRLARLSALARARRTGMAAEGRHS